MKDVVDKCSTKGCAIDIGTVIDNDNCTSKFSRFFATREEAESFYDQTERACRRCILCR